MLFRTMIDLQNVEIRHLKMFLNMYWLLITNPTLIFSLFKITLHNEIFEYLYL